MMKEEIRTAVVGPNTRVIFVQTSTQLIQSTRSTDFILLRQVPALETSMAVHRRSSHDLP